LVRKSNAKGGGRQREAEIDGSVPGIILFHTAVGPNDIFLLYRAAALVNTLKPGCVVMIADLLSDGTGWGWNADKTRFQDASRELLQRVNGSGRRLLQQRLVAAVDFIINSEQARVDSQRLGALGFCFGGYAVQELGQMQESSSYCIRGMVTFHGVFDANRSAASSAVTNERRVCEVLICNGTDDPFVSSDMVEAALQSLQESRNTVSLLQLKGARHGFSNPAQAFNANQASFGYDADAALKSWRQAMALLSRRLAS
jgi:dienelactone hydrolase